MGIIDKFDDTVRLNLRRFGLTALPLFSVTVALNAPLEVALLCDTSCSALALLGSRPAKIRPTVGRQMYRTAHYLLVNFALFAENSTIKPCLLFAMQRDGLDAWRARFRREATRTLLRHSYDRINGALRNDDVVVHTSDHQFYALVVVNDYVIRPRHWPSETVCKRQLTRGSKSTGDHIISACQWASRTVGIIHKLPPKDWSTAQIAH